MAKSVAMTTGGTLFGLSNDNRLTYVYFAEAVNIRGPNAEVKDINVTHLLSPEACEEFLAGYINGGEIVIDINYNPADFALVNDFLGVNDNDFILSWPDGSSLIFSGYVKVWGNEFPVNDKVGTSCTVKVSGPFDVTIA